MEAICFGRQSRFSALTRLQDAIGWKRLLEGMVSAEIAKLKQQHLQVSGSRMSIYGWMTGLIIKLLEITHQNLCTKEDRNRWKQYALDGRHASARSLARRMQSDGSAY